MVTRNPMDILQSIMSMDDSFFHERTPPVNMENNEPLENMRQGGAFQLAQNELRNTNPEGKLIGLILSIDDTNLTNHSGVHNGRPLYMTTANQSLESRRKRKTNSWRILALLPIIQLAKEKRTPQEKYWITHAKIEFANRMLEFVLQPLIGN